MSKEFFIFTTIQFVVALAIANFLGKKRNIGFGRTLVISLTLTPIAGLICAGMSRKLTDHPDSSMRKKNWVRQVGFALLCIGVISLGSVLYSTFKSKDRDENRYYRSESSETNNNLPTLIAGLGLIVLGYYMCDWDSVDIKNN